MNLYLARHGQILDDIKRQHTSQNILAVTHGDIGKMIYAAYYQLSWQEVLTQFHFGNSELLQLSSVSSPGQAHVFLIEQYNQ